MLLIPTSERWVRRNLGLRETVAWIFNFEKPFFRETNASTTQSTELPTAPDTTSYRKEMSLHLKWVWLPSAPFLLQLMLRGPSFSSTDMVRWCALSWLTWSMKLFNAFSWQVCTRITHAATTWTTEFWLWGTARRMEKIIGWLKTGL